MNEKKKDIIARHTQAMEKGNKTMYVHAIAYGVLRRLLEGDTITKQELINELIEKRDIHDDEFSRRPYQEAIDLIENPAQIEAALR